MPESFVLHAQLEKDTFALAELSLCAVRAMDVAALPWLVLVPRVDGARDTIDLSTDAQRQLMEEIALVSRALRAGFNPHKLNVAALGNVVSQLHVHVVARFTDDAAWPKPVWGNLPMQPYLTDQREEFRLIFAKALSSVKN